MLQISNRFIAQLRRMATLKEEMAEFSDLGKQFLKKHRTA
jgi:hypothetical protein